MTREEAIKLLTQYIDYDAETPNYYEMEKACRVAIKALKQEPCEDCISRIEAINAISHAEVSFQVESELNFENYKREVQEIADGILKGQVKALSDLPSVQPIKPKGEWIDNHSRDFTRTMVCSICKNEAISNEWDYVLTKFCPNCGSDMRGTT